MAPSRNPKRSRSFSSSHSPLPGLFRKKLAHIRYSTGCIPEEPDEMPLFTRNVPSIRLSANPTREDQMNAFLSSDVHAEFELEDSFASNMSLNSPPHTQRHIGLPDSPDAQQSGDYAPMDISPAPPRVFHPPPQQANAHAHYYRPKAERERDTNHTLQLPLPSAAADKIAGRPGAYTGSGRLFGTDVSNAGLTKKKDDDQGSEKDKNGRRLQRAALPFEWMSTRENTGRSASQVSSSTSTRHFLVASPLVLHVCWRIVC